MCFSRSQGKSLAVPSPAPAAIIGQKRLGSDAVFCALQMLTQGCEGKVFSSGPAPAPAPFGADEVDRCDCIGWGCADASPRQRYPGISYGQQRCPLRPGAVCRTVSEGRAR